MGHIACNSPRSSILRFFEVAGGVMVTGRVTFAEGVMKVAAHSAGVAASSPKVVVDFRRAVSDPKAAAEDMGWFEG